MSDIRMVVPAAGVLLSASGRNCAAPTGCRSTCGFFEFCLDFQCRSRDSKCCLQQSVLKPTVIGLHDVLVPLIQKLLPGFLLWYVVQYSFHTVILRLECLQDLPQFDFPFFL